MFNYLFIFVVLVYVIKRCQSQDYDDVDYNLREDNAVSVESNQEVAPFKKIENDAKTLLNDIKDKSEAPETKSPRLKQVTNEKVMDLSNEIETMMKEIKSSVSGAKKYEQYKTDKNYDSDETKVAINIQNKHIQCEEKSEEAKVVKSPKHRVKTEISKDLVINDFYERDDYDTTGEPKPCKHSEQFGSHEQSEELIKTNKNNHVKREDHKTMEAKLSQISHPSNENYLETNKPHTLSKETGNTKPFQNSEETKSLKTRNSEPHERYKSAEEKLATICENCKKYQVEPYVNPKEAKHTKLRRTKNDFESKEDKSFDSKTIVFENTKHIIARSQKHKDQNHEEMEKSEERKSVKPCQPDSEIGRSGRINNHGKDLKSKSVEIEISKSKQYKHQESSEEHERNKPYRHVIPEEVDAIGNGNETTSAESYKPKRYIHDDESVEISETQQDRVEHIGQADDVNAQIATGCGEIKDKVKTEEVEKKTKTVVSYPFSVSIQRKGAHFATGALLDKNWILTVAGEFYNVRESIKLYKARLGSVNCKRGGTLLALKRIEIHPLFVSNSPNFDLALIMIAKPVEFNDMIKPIGLSGIKTQVISAKFMTTYWSRVIIKGHVLPVTANERIKQTSLRVSTQKLIPWDWCETLLEMGHASLNPSTLCLRPIESHHSLCMPDAGAPVVAEDGLWGITSGWTSKNCPSNPSPTVFTRVSSPYVQPWLDSNLNRTRLRFKMW